MRVSVLRHFSIGLLALVGLNGGLVSQAWSQESTVIKVSEKNVGDALALALVMAAKRKVDFSGKNQRPILNEEVAPHSGQFVSSYKVLGGSGRGWVNLEATVDVTALKSIFAINSSNFKGTAPKAAILVRGHNGNAIWRGSEYDELESDLVSKLEASARVRLERRGFKVLPRISEYLDFVDEINADSGPTMRAIAQRLDADLVLYLAPQFKVGQTTGASGVRFYISGVMYDRERDLVLSSTEQSMPMWLGEKAIKSKNEKVTEALMEHVDNTVHEVFMLGGSRLQADIASVSYVTVRVLTPPDYFALDQFRTNMQQVRGVRTIVERKITPGEFDFWVDSEISRDRLAKEIRGLVLENYSVTSAANVGTADEASIAIKLERKKSPADGSTKENSKEKTGA